MTSREKILREIKAGKVNRPAIELGIMEEISYVDKTAQFIDVLTSIGGKVQQIEDNDSIEKYTQSAAESGEYVLQISNGQQLDLSIEEMYEVDMLVVEGSFGVAENGAIWIKEQNMGNRLLPFSCQQLVVVMSEKNIVHNMHEAYELISLHEVDYGVFIAGPSKTADIEQSLVIGAHGPISFNVLLTK